MADILTLLFFGTSVGAAVGAILERRLDSLWRVVLGDTSVGIAGAAISVFVSNSDWIRARAAERSLLNPGLTDPVVALLAHHPIVVAGFASAFAVVLWRGIRAILRRRQ